MKVFEDASTPENGKEYWYITNEGYAREGIFSHENIGTYGLNDKISGQPVYYLMTEFLFRSIEQVTKFLETFFLDEHHEDKDYISMKYGIK